MIVAIDGPAGSGKTTIAKLLAKKLNISYLDTGATYRALTLKALETATDLNSGPALKQLAGKLKISFEGERILIDGRNVSSEIRTPEIDKNISLVVSYPEVRDVMVNLQRAAARNKSFVVEGRDITTVVFPRAEFKFYLDADFSERAKRRFRQLNDKGIKIDIEELKADLEKRDNADKTRKVGPLVLSSEATYVDTTGLSISQVVDKLLKLININGR